MHKLLNLGCGSQFVTNSGWVNIDFSSDDPNVLQHNLLQGIPFPDNAFDVVYHSHVLEHFTRMDGAKFIEECFRVLKPGGVLRVVLPDLEQICRLYLTALENAKADDATWEMRYEWVMLELYDQCVRTKSGGAMADYLRSRQEKDTDFILSRIGRVGRDLISPVVATPTEGSPSPSRLMRSLRIRLGNLLSHTRRECASFFLTESELTALENGLFRNRGEVHQWMYDEYSLGKLLSRTGFAEIQRYCFNESRIPLWSSCLLDVDSLGLCQAPSSVYMEGIKPK